MMTALFDRLAGRRQQRTGHALDTLASAARDAAAGRTVDVAGIDDALHELHKPPEFFKQLCDVAEKRQAAGVALEKLGVATGKARKIAEAIDAETRRYEEARKAYLARMSALETDKATLDQTIEAANRARSMLLQLENVIGSDRPRYEEALAERDAATVEVERLRRDVRQQRSKIEEADRWLADVHRRYERELQPPVAFARPNRSQKELAEIEPHELAKSRAQQRIKEIEPQLRDAEDRLDRAERAVVAIELVILKV
jgi:DNA repair exonuclease SbcCD ATPase subunit